jgi:uncharacterized phiE125 gp8 family phage protein
MQFKFIQGSGFPVEFSDVINHIKLVDSNDNALVSGMLNTAIEFVELKTNRELTAKQFEMYLDEFPETEIFIQKCPVTGVSKVEYISTGDTSYTTWDASKWQFDAISEPARIKPASDESFPSLNEDVYNAVKVTFECGYPDAASVPVKLKAAIYMIVEHLYTHRGDEGHRTIPKVVTDLINQEKMYWYG